MNFQQPGSTSFHTSSATGAASATPSSVQGSEEPLLQTDMKGRIEGELKGRTYFVDLTGERGILYASPSIVEAVNGQLEATREALTSEGSSSATDPRIPATGFSSETRSYKPLTHLLNKIIETAEVFKRESPLHGLRFRVFTRELSDIYGNHKPLKPDLVGIIGELPVETEEPTEGPAKERAEEPVSWEKVEVAVECKSTVRDMVRQSGTYARCCVSSNRRRFFSLGIGFQYKRSEAYFNVFHRAGLSSSRPFKVTTPEGFELLVKHVVGILSIDEATYLDPTRFENFFCINNRCYEIIRIIYVRHSLGGRSTIVYSLQAVDAFPHPGMESRTLTLSGVDHLPDELTYKLSYHTKGGSQEGPLFSQFTGQFGIADVIGYYECGTEDSHGSTMRLMSGAEHWDVFGRNDIGGNDSRHDPEDRGLHCIALSGEGKALIDLKNQDGGTPSPGELLECILHAIIGHYNLFTKGILHRDISSWNVLRYAEPVRRPALDKFECTRNVNYCQGFLIDGDQAIKWREYTGSQTISGTMPFMSMRLLIAWQGGRATIHTALDDLESFLWVLIWGIVHATKDIEGARTANGGIDRMLTAWSGDLTYNLTKSYIAQKGWKDAVFGDLIKEWLGIFDKATEDTKKRMDYLPTILNNQQGSEWGKACDWLESYCTEVYENLLKSGFNHLEKVGKYSNWTEVVAANSQAEPMSDDMWV